MPNPGDRFNPYRFFNGVTLPEVLLQLSISWGAKVCYGRLTMFAGNRGFAFPKQETLGAALGISGRQVRTYLKELEDEKLIRREKGAGAGQPSRYVFLWHPIFHRDLHSYSDGEEHENTKTSPSESDRKPTSAMTGRNPSSTGGLLPVSKEKTHVREDTTPPTPPKHRGGAGRKTRKTKPDRMREDIHRRLKRDFAD